jgi:hypothetical protein
MSTVSKTEELNESNRYIGGSDGQPINLAQTTGHFSLRLTKVRKFSHLTDESNVQLNENKDDKKTTSVAQVKTESKVESKNKTKEDESTDNKDGTNDCALNAGGGKGVTSHVQ